MLHRSRNSGRDVLVEPAPLWASSYTHVCTKLKIHSAHASGQIVPKQVFFLGRQFGRETSLCFTDQETQEEMFWWNQLPCGPVLTPISCTKLKIHSAHASGQILPKQVFFSLPAIWKRHQFMLHRSRNSGRDFWWNQLLCVPVLTPISCTKLKIHSAHSDIDSPIVPKQVFLILCQ